MNIWTSENKFVFILHKFGYPIKAIKTKTIQNDTNVNYKIKDSEHE